MNCSHVGPRLRGRTEVIFATSATLVGHAGRRFRINGRFSSAHSLSGRTAVWLALRPAYARRDPVRTGSGNMARLRRLMLIGMRAAQVYQQRLAKAAVFIKLFHGGRRVAERLEAWRPLANTICDAEIRVLSMTNGTCARCCRRATLGPSDA